MTITTDGLRALAASPEVASRTTRLRDGRLVVLFPLHDRVRFDGIDGALHHGVITERMPDDLYLVKCDDSRMRVVHADAIWPF